MTGVFAAGKGQYYSYSWVGIAHCWDSDQRVQRCMEWPPVTPAPINVVLESEEAEEFLGLLQRMLSWVPRNRKTAKEPLEHTLLRDSSNDMDEDGRENNGTGVYLAMEDMNGRASRLYQLYHTKNLAFSSI